jgi:glycosyltransferase involved in cell wall biosynthesis
MKPILSICIPTFNRAKYLQELLESIKISCIGHLNYIEVVISNNTSTDNTAEVVDNYKQYFPNIQYHNHSEALLPAEKNFLFVAQQAKGVYVWLMGDDDKLNKDAILIISQSLISNAEVYITNFSLASKDMATKYSTHYHDFKFGLTFNNKNKLLSTFGPTLSLISSVIFKKELLPNINEKEYFHHSEWGMSFLFFIYSTVSNQLKAEFIQQPVFTYRCDNSNIDNWGRVFVNGMAKTVESLKLYDYSRVAIISAKNVCIKKYIFRELLSRKARNSDCRTIIQGLYSHYLFTSTFWLYCFPIMIFPGNLLFKARNFYQKYFKK